MDLNLFNSSWKEELIIVRPLSVRHDREELERSVEQCGMDAVGVIWKIGEGPDFGQSLPFTEAKLRDSIEPRPVIQATPLQPFVRGRWVIAIG